MGLRHVGLDTMYQKQDASDYDRMYSCSCAIPLNVPLTHENGKKRYLSIYSCSCILVKP